MNRKTRFRLYIFTDLQKCKITGINYFYRFQTFKGNKEILTLNQTIMKRNKPMVSKNVRNIVSAVIMTFIMLLPVVSTTLAGAPIHDSNAIQHDDLSGIGEKAINKTLR